MLTLMKKDLPIFGSYTLTLLILGYAYGFLRNRPLDIPWLIMQGQWIFLLILGGLIISESRERKLHGYHFLKTLPLSAKKIVQAKFGLISVLVMVIVTSHVFMLSLFSPPEELLAVARMYILLCGNLCLFAAALIYYLIQKFGFTRFAKIGWSLMILVGISPIILTEWILATSPFRTDILLRFHTVTNWILVFFFNLSACWLLMKAAEKKLSLAVPE